MLCHTATFRRRVRLLGWLVLLLAARLGGAQPQASDPGPFVFKRASQQQAHLRFFTQRNLIIVSARLNGIGPLNFILDTGVATSLLTDPLVADSLHLPRGQEYRIMGVGGADEALRAYELNQVAVTMPGGVVAPKSSWLVLSSDVLDLSGYVGMRIHGLIGADFFRSFVVTIQPERFELLLHAPATYRAPKAKRWATLPLRFEQGKAYLTAAIKQLGTGGPEALPLQLVLDTGAGHALSLETTADRRLRLPPTCLRTDLGRGLSGIVSGALGRVAAVQLGHYQLPYVLTSFPDSSQVHQRLSAREKLLRQGNLGYEVLKRFVCVIDYPHQRLLLRATPALREPFEHDMSGIDLMAMGKNYRRYLVQRVMPGSPAEEAGIEPEEEIMSVNFVPATTYSISELNRLLHSEDGRLLVFMLRRPNGNVHPAAVRLKRRI